MYQHQLHQQINKVLQEFETDIAGVDNPFYVRFMANAASLHHLFTEIYGKHPKADKAFHQLLCSLIINNRNRPDELRVHDEQKMELGHWFLSNQITGMSLYVDRFCGNLKEMEQKISYLQNLGVNLLHLMPLFSSPPGESDGGYAVSDFRKVDERFGSLEDLKNLRRAMGGEKMYLMLDIVLNHTSHRHEWAEKAKAGEREYQAYYYMYADRTLPDRFDRSMPEIFPESAPGNFTWVEECKRWVMTVFHNYQWDLNYTNPAVFLAMLENIFFYANLGVDILRIDAPAFIWKEAGTTCQNLPQAHFILRLIKQCVQIATPGMALLGEAIVQPGEIMKYFGTGLYTSRECDLAYNATQMALQWDALATGDTRVMLAAQHELLQKPFGATWITYTRCHDDIGLGYEDYMIQQAGFEPIEHRKFLQRFYSGQTPGSTAKGALFSVNPKTQDARISGTLASLCGLEKALEEGNSAEVEESIARILMMQAQTFFIGGIPMLFYGDEVGYTNDYSYLTDPGKSYDNRWMHRPVINWQKNARNSRKGSPENRVFSATRKLIDIRNKLGVTADHKNLSWMSPHNIHVAGFVRTREQERLFCLFNYSNQTAFLTWFAFKEHGKTPAQLYDHWEEKIYQVGHDHEYLQIKPYGFLILEATA